MIRKMLLIAAAAALPSMAAAQDAPNDHASDMAKARSHGQRATEVRGAALPPESRPVTPATRAVPATRATPATPNPDGGAATPATPAIPATPAVPASPSQKPASPGQSGAHRP